MPVRRFTRYLAVATTVALIAVASRVEAQVEAPADALESITLGAITLTTYTPVTITPVENSTNVYVAARNTGSRTLTLSLAWPEVQNSKPSWILQFYKFFGFERVGQPTTVQIQAGQTRTLKFYVSKDSVPPNGTITSAMPLAFRIAETGEQATLTFRFVGDDRLAFFRATSATISGTVTSPAGPVAGALVSVGLVTEKGVKQTRTAADGSYSIEVVSIDDIKRALGPRPLPYRSVEWFLTAEAEGYSMAYRGGLTPSTGQTLTVHATLEPAGISASYNLVGQLETSGTRGYWWLRFAGNGDRVVAVQGEHADAPGAGHIIAVDLSGRELWRLPTRDQCWGMDVSPDGRRIAVGCYDSQLYLVSHEGALLRQIAIGDRSGGEVMSVRFSPDGRFLLVDGASGAGGFSVLNVETGLPVWTSTSIATDSEVMRAYKSRWSADGSRVVVANFGPLAVYSSAGALLWRVNIGESPLWLEMDRDYNVYAAGKNRELTSWDANGNERWSFRLAHTSNAGGDAWTADTSFLVVPTFNGVLQALTSTGNVVWQRFLPTIPTVMPSGMIADFLFGPGHNAMSMTLTGDLIAVGTRGYQLVVYGRNGTLLWSHSASQRPSFTGPPPSYPGTNAVAISPDGRYIAAGYADSVLRIFAAR